MAVAASKRKAVPEVRSHASSARYDARRVVAAFPDTDKAEEAGRILQQTQDLDSGRCIVFFMRDQS